MSKRRRKGERVWRYSTLDFAILQRIEQHMRGDEVEVSWLRTARERGWLLLHGRSEWRLTRLGEREWLVWRKLTGRARRAD